MTLKYVTMVTSDLRPAGHPRGERVWSWSQLTSHLHLMTSGTSADLTVMSPLCHHDVMDGQRDFYNESWHWRWCHFLFYRSVLDQIRRLITAVVLLFLKCFLNVAVINRKYNHVTSLHHHVSWSPTHAWGRSFVLGGRGLNSFIGLVFEGCLIPLRKLKVETH